MPSGAAVKVVYGRIGEFQPCSAKERRTASATAVRSPATLFWSVVPTSNSSSKSMLEAPEAEDRAADERAALAGSRPPPWRATGPFELSERSGR